jgi:exodeoxyribonuclease VII small subunit
MTEEEKTAPESISFEGGYEELKRITARLGQDDVPIDEMFNLLRRGKGLEKSLRAYLEAQEGELQEIEAGKSLTEFEIVARSSENSVDSE